MNTTTKKVRKAKEYTVKQLQYKGGPVDNTHWVKVWTGLATNEKDAKEKALDEGLILIAITE